MTFDPIAVAPDQLAVVALDQMQHNRRKTISVFAGSGRQR